MPVHVHTRQLAAAGREILAPLGLTQKGGSPVARTWIDDHGWWLDLVQFMPEPGEPGTFLNVGPVLLWSPRAALLSVPRVALGDRRGFTAFRSEEAFAAEARGLPRTAAEHVAAQRDHLATMPGAAAWLASLGIHQRVDAAIAAGLAGDREGARSHLRVDRTWAERDGGREEAWVADLEAAIDGGREALRDHAARAVRRNRAALGLPEADPRL